MIDSQRLVFKNIELVNHIKSGAFGKVDHVRLLDTGEEFAMKTFLNSDFRLEENRRDRLRFVREFASLRTLPPTVAIPVVGASLDGERPFFLMELAGGNFDEFIGEAHPSEKYREALLQILEALSFIHDDGRVHRDLKPDNILRYNDRWVLGDFGLAATDSARGLTKLTNTYDRGGTLKYMAPEQLEDLKSATGAADIYAFGCILHDIFGRTGRAACQQHSCPGPMGRIIERCTEFLPEDRIQSAEKLRDLIARMWSQGSLSTDPGWTEKLTTTSLGQWSPDEVSALVEYLSSQDEKRIEILPFLSASDLTTILRLCGTREERIARTLLKWSAEADFHYSVADSRASCVEVAERHLPSGPQVMLNTLLALLNIGCSGNRYDVMRSALSRLGPSMSPELRELVLAEFLLEPSIALQIENSLRALGEPPSSLDSSVYQAIAAIRPAPDF